MRILYGVQATGNGHINRSREVVSALKQAGHSVSVLFSGRDRSQLWDVEAFEPFSVYKGLTFGVSRGKVSYIKTLRNLNPVRFLRDISGFDPDSFDLIITDFEPLSAWIAKRHGTPSIGLGRQYAFRYSIPRPQRDIIASLVLNYFAPARYSIGLHYYHFNQPILPPIISNLSCGEVKGIPKKILVYLPFEEPGDVKQLIKPFNQFDFFVYTAIDKPLQENHISFLPLSREGFVKDLKSCSGVICNAGFTLTSEALHLGKKLLVRPLAGQIEQASNALALQQLNLGKVMLTLDEKMVGNWLISPSPPPVNYPEVAPDVVKWIGEGKWHNTRELVNRIWSKVDEKLFRITVL
jgi:uncharacterized protein (TIGR00661 family)